MKIQEDGRGGVAYFWFNFLARGTGDRHPGNPDGPGPGPGPGPSIAGFATFGAESAFATLDRCLTPAQWAALWPDPGAEQLRGHEERQIDLSDRAILEIYCGMIWNEAQRAGGEGESHRRVAGGAEHAAFREEYAAGLKRASGGRDAMVTRRAEIEHRPDTPRMAGRDGHQRGPSNPAGVPPGRGSA